MTDPFWSEVARLLPDADLVLLPPEDSPGHASNDSRLIGAVRARLVRDEAHRAFVTAWQELAPGEPPPETIRRTWRSLQPDGQLVQLELVARKPGWPAVGIRELLAAARTHQLAADRSVDERRWADSDGLRLVTGIEGHNAELYAALTPPAITLTVLATPAPVPVELGRELVAIGTEQLPYGTLSA